MLYRWFYATPWALQLFFKKGEDEPDFHSSKEQSRVKTVPRWRRIASERSAAKSHFHQTWSYAASGSMGFSMAQVM